MNEEGIFDHTVRTPENTGTVTYRQFLSEVLGK
jgi:hypothetical protein